MKTYRLTFKSTLIKTLFLSATIGFFFLLNCNRSPDNDNNLKLNDLDYFETRGLNVLVFSNWYSGLFSDSKISGIEIIHHEVRTATNGDVRLNPTPEQWDPIPEFIERKVSKENNCIEAFLTYPEYELSYMIKAIGFTGSFRGGKAIFDAAAQRPEPVEVCQSMIHGGPFPATTDSRSTSVGTAAITRFTRPVCYQNFPDDILPD